MLMFSHFVQKYIGDLTGDRNLDCYLIIDMSKVRYWYMVIELIWMSPRPKLRSHTLLSLLLLVILENM
jgi:hypothetical protein